MFGATGFIDPSIPIIIYKWIIKLYACFKKGQFFLKIQIGILLHQCAGLFIITPKEISMLLRSRIERFMLVSQLNGLYFLDQVPGLFIHARINKFLPHILGGKIIRMYKVFCIKTIITQIIYYQFIGWEIKETVE